MYGEFALLPYQYEGRDFLTTPQLGGKNHKYLAWAPGTGKTIIAIAASIELRLQTLLIVCPVKIKRTWAKRLVQAGFCEESEIEIVWTTSQPVISKRVTIVSFELLLSPIITKQLKRYHYDGVFVDEVHRAKSITSQRSNIIFGKDALIGYGRVKWVFSGTPAPNGNPIEIFPQVSTMFPECIDHVDYESFALKWCGAYEVFNGYGREIQFGNGSLDIKPLRERLKGYMHFKTIEEVAEDLPPVIEKLVYIDIGRLGSDEHNTPMATLQRLIGEAKIPQVVEYVQDWFEQNPGQKLVLFAYHREVIERVHTAFCNDGAERIYGGMTEAQKENALQTFYGNWCNLLVVQINSAGEAIDGLQHVANHIIFAEPDWTPGVGNQAIGRLYRIGQTKPTYVTTIVAEKTLDETKVRKYDRKQDIIDQYFERNDECTQQRKEQTKMTMTTEQIDRLIDIGERIIDALLDRNSEGNDEETKTTKRKRRTKAEIEAAQTNVVPMPTANSAPPAVAGVNAGNGGSNGQTTIQVSPQPIQTELPKSFQEVVDAATACKERLIAQVKAANPQLSDDAIYEQAVGIIRNDIVKAHGLTALQDAEKADAQKWLQLQNEFASKQYVPTPQPALKMDF